MARRIRKTYSYEPSSDMPDLAEQIEKLRRTKSSPYNGRSHADTAGMILQKYIAEEVKEYEQGDC